MANTPVKSWPYPLESDVPDVASDIHALALALDNVPNCWAGTLAGRASVTTQTAGDFYLVIGDSTPTNNGVLWTWNGSAWVVPGQPPWTNMTKGSGWTNNGSNDPFAARVAGDTIEFRGSMANGASSVAAGVTIATMPALMVPSNGRSFMGWVQNPGATSTVAVPGSVLPGSGNVFLNASVGANFTVWFDGQFFST